jgi:hypothetical protein
MRSDSLSASIWRTFLQRIKKNVSQTLDIATDQLHEISLEDIEIEQDSRRRIYKALHDMAVLSDLHNATSNKEKNRLGVPCTGFWVADTRDLVLFAWCQHKSKTIVVPAEEWFLREDITVH